MATERPEERANVDERVGQSHPIDSGRRFLLGSLACVVLTVGALALGMPDLLGHGYVDSPFGLALGFAGIAGALYIDGRRVQRGLAALNPTNVAGAIRSADGTQRAGAVRWLACAIAAVIGGIAVIVLHVIAVTYFGA